MSVLFGQLSADLTCFRALQAHFQSVWPERTLQVCDLAEHQAGAAAGQPPGYFPGVQVVYDAQALRLYALSGYIWTSAGFPLDEPSAQKAIIEAGTRLIEQGKLDLPDDWGGVFSLAVFDLAQREMWLAGDPSGLLPLYYAQYGDGLVFSSYSRPLARAMQTQLDPIGVIQTTALRYTIGPRTLYRNVYRLRPGESLHYSQYGQKLRFSQPRKIYSAIDAYHSPDEAADALWADYLDGARQVTRPEGKYGIMLSGGVDSRLVLVGFHHFQKPLVTVTMGDEENREVGIAQRVAQLAGAESIQYTPVQDTAPSKERIDRLIDRAEWASFPFMESCAQIMRRQGASSASTGFGGEIFLGGHAFFVLGNKWDERSRFKMALRRSLGLSNDFRWPVSSGNIATTIDSIRNFSMKAFKSHQSYLQPSWLPYYNQAVEIIGDEIAAEIKRLLSNEPATIQQLVEHYWLEHYTRDFCRQEFTQFTQLPIALPTLHHTFYRRCSNLDPEQKVDHGIYLRLVQRHYGQFAQLPTANIPLPLRYPDLVLWLARAYRAIYDRNVVRKQKMTRGMYSRQRFGWFDYEKWVRQTDFLKRMPDLVLSPIYNRDYLREKTQRILAWQERYYSGQELWGLISTSGMAQGFQI